jgi:hypothetical protein
MQRVLVAVPVVVKVTIESFISNCQPAWTHCMSEMNPADVIEYEMDNLIGRLRLTTIYTLTLILTLIPDPYNPVRAVSMYG